MDLHSFTNSARKSHFAMRNQAFRLTGRKCLKSLECEIEGFRETFVFSDLAGVSFRVVFERGRFAPKAALGARGQRPIAAFNHHSTQFWKAEEIVRQKIVAPANSGSSPLLHGRHGADDYLTKRGGRFRWRPFRLPSCHMTSRPRVSPRGAIADEPEAGEADEHHRPGRGLRDCAGRAILDRLSW